MGIFINMKLSDTITQAEWNPVYAKSLLMAEKFGFFDFGKKSIHGENVLCIFPTQEKEVGKKIGWRTIGSFPEYKRAEDQFMPKYLGIESRENESYDVLRSEIYNVRKVESNEQHYHFIWGNKTQGEPYHMGLLAIACMAEQQLGIQAMVGGDITYRQCMNAAELASDILGEKIGLPVSCRLNDLHERIKKFDDLTELEKLKLLMEVYLGDENGEMGEFLRQNYSEKAIAAYWQEQFKDTKIDTYGFNSLMKRYFLLSPDMRRFCELADFDKSDAEQCTQFIRKIMQSKIHLQEKDCYDPLDYKHYEIPYGIGNLMASFFLRGTANPAINRYIPLDKIRTILNDCFGAVVNVNEIIDSCLYEMEHPTEESGHDMLMNYAGKYAQEQEEYDISKYDELPNFKTGIRLSPGLQKAVGKAYALFREYGSSAECERHLIHKPDEMFHVLAANYDGCFLTEEHWEHIWDELHRAPQTFRRYYPMTRVTHDGDLEYLLRALLMDDDFWNYCGECFKEEN